MESIKHFYQWFTNPKKERIITKEIYLNKIIFVAAFTFFTLIFVNYYLELYNIALLSLIVFSVVIISWLINRYTKKNQITFAINFITLVISLNLFYTINNGAYGPTVFFIFPVTFVILYFSGRKLYITISSIIILNTIVYSYLEFQHIIESTPYQNNFTQHLDIYVSVIITLFITMALLTDLIKIQINEKNISQESNKLKTEFIANMTQNITKPTNSISSLCEMINKNEVSNYELPDTINKIQHNSKQLLELVNSIFEISLIESKNIHPEPVLFNLKEQCERCREAADLSIIVAQKNIKLISQFDPNVKNIYSDPNKIQKIIYNLLQNAIKDTRSGSITFGFEKEIDTNSILFFVKDTGSGISKQSIGDNFLPNLPKISTQKNNTDVTEIRLQITKRLVEIIRGTIWVYSEIGKGTQYFIRLPISIKKPH
jgi:signal transduction histidine kinase